MIAYSNIYVFDVENAKGPRHLVSEIVPAIFDFPPVPIADKRS